MKDLDARNDAAILHDEDLENVVGGYEEDIRRCPVCGSREVSSSGDGTCNNCRKAASHVPPPYITN